MGSHVCGYRRWELLEAVWDDSEWLQDVEHLETTWGDIECTLAWTTGTTFKHQRVMWPGLYRKLRAFLGIMV